MECIGRWVLDLLEEPGLSLRRKTLVEGKKHERVQKERKTLRPAPVFVWTQDPADRALIWATSNDYGPKIYTIFYIERCF